MSRLGFLVLLILVALLLGSCTANPEPTPAVPSPETATAPSGVPTEDDLPTPAPPMTMLAPTVQPTPGSTALPDLTPHAPLTGCRLGTGLRKEMAPVVVQHKDNPALVMAASDDMAQTYFPQLEGWIRVLGAPSLESLEARAEWAEQIGLPYEALGYGLETGKNTPDAEWQDLVSSARQARAVADRYGKLLVMGPGFRLMSQNEDKYAAMAALSHYWILQTQVMQATSLAGAYPQDVERVVGLIRAGNPDIEVWAQITLLPDRPPNASEWLAFREAINDLVDGTYLGIYTWQREDPELLVSTMEEIFAAACSGESSGP